MSTPIPSPLPRPFTTLIGREHDIASIGAILQASSGSILTLIGPAGVGKTRLALAVAESLEPVFPDGVRFVDLAPVQTAREVLPAIVRALGLADGPDPSSQLAQALRNRALVLLIDNFEHVLAAGPALNASLAGAPEVRVLVTSQAPLHVQGEREFAVEPLPVPPPPPAGEGSPAMLERYRTIPAIRLFVERARQVRPAFELTTANLAAVVAICHHLDGIPLAIELAAARGNVLSPQALANQLGGSLHVLSGGPRDAPDRHRTLRTAIEWSYGLLDPRESLLLDRLSVFSGSFTLSAAEAVAGNAPIGFGPSKYIDPDPGLPPAGDTLDWTGVFDLLDRLVDQSLVQRIESVDAEPRFRLFRTIRQFAAAKLATREEGERTALRHATWFHTRAEATWGPDGVATLEQNWLEELDADVENLRAALDYFSEHDPTAALVMASSLVWFYYIRGRRAEGIQAIERVAGRADRSSLSPMIDARVDFSLGNLLALFSDTRETGIALLESVLARIESLGETWAVGYTLVALGVLMEDSGAYQDALDYLDRARALLEVVNDPPTLANLDFHVGVSLFGLGNLDAARAKAAQVAGAARERGGLNIAYALHLLAMIDLAEGNHPAAARNLLAASDWFRQHGEVATATELLDATATVLERCGDPERSARLFGAADRQNAESGNPITLPERTHYDAARSRIRGHLGEQRVQELLDEGNALALHDAYALMRDALQALAAEDAPAASPLPVFGPANPFGLTNRETEVLRLVAQGMSDREISDALFISYGTARTHVRNILGKMDAPNRSAATTLALRSGMVDLSEAG